MACLCSWIVMILLRNTRSFRNPNRKKSGRVRSGDRAGQAMSPKLRTQVTRCCTFQHSTATDHMKWRPLLYRSPSRQPRQAIAPARYSNLKCVSRRRATLYIKIQLELRGNTHFVICEFSRGNKTFYRLQEKYKKCDTSPFTGEQETRYLAVYERMRNASARLSREKNKKRDISPFTRDWEMRQLVFHERRTRNATSRR